MNGNQGLDEKAIEVATLVIIHAGNARQYIRDALKLAQSGNFMDIPPKLEMAENEIASAHKTQTEIIQAEARGKKQNVSLLLTHAQDTLMTTMNEIELARYLIDIYRQLPRLEKIS